MANEEKEEEEEEEKEKEEEEEEGEEEGEEGKTVVEKKSKDIVKIGDVLLPHP